MICSSPCQTYYCFYVPGCGINTFLPHLVISSAVLLRLITPAPGHGPYHPLHSAIGYPPSARYGQHTLSAVDHSPAALYFAQLKVLSYLGIQLGRKGRGRVYLPAHSAHSGGRICVDVAGHCIRDAWHRHSCSDSAGYSTSSVKSRSRLVLSCMQSVSLLTGLRVSCSQTKGDIYADLLNDDHALDACAGFMSSHWVVVSLCYWLPGG